MVRLLCAGEVIVEMVADQVRQSMQHEGQWTGPYPSGAPAILADQAALCGVEVRLIGCVGADAFGQVCTERLRSDGVDLTHVAVSKSRTTGVAFVSYQADGARNFVFHVAQSAAAGFTEADFETALEQVDCVHIMGSTAFSPEATEALEKLAQLATARGIPVSFDPNLRPEMLTEPSFVISLQRILSQASIVLASKDELPPLMGLPSDQECIDTLLDNQAEVVVFKQGANGASLHRKGAAPLRALPIPVTEVDATGAGDCFGGTFLAQTLSGADDHTALNMANAAGAHAVTQRGPMSGNLPLSELRQFLSQSSH